MNKKCKVGPDIVYGFQIIFLYNPFHAHLYPCRYSHYKSDIPVRSLVNNSLYFFIPVAGAGNFLSGFIKRSEPYGHLPGRNTTKVTCIITRAFLQIGASSQHQPSLSYTFHWVVLLMTKGKQLPDHCKSFSAHRAIG